ncbi:MAG: YciI family protein [Pseudomonadota bacterium]|uniref:YciI family protein n=1 Tax=Polaromonas sp. TaxID=1869339 RepID=UPI0017F44F6C|nr:YciI family protein [Polaromonas sp.]MBA3592562.1 hypothetical protein [Polaromonas sp.]MDQ3272069.1 YciI family protein [Pseudomonadota bacterium]
MQYLCLAYYDPEKMDVMAPADMKTLVEALPAKDAALAQTGKLVWSGSLEGPKATFGMRPRGGKPQVTDGPYAEAKELVGGFFVIEAADKEEAIRIASLHPAATLGEHIGWGIEVHPIGICSVKK